MLLNCGVGESSWESLGLQGDLTSPSERNRSWIFIGRTDVEAETPILWPPHAKKWLWKRPWCWERLKVGGEGDDRGWDGWMASPTQWTWVWVDSSSWWWTGRPGMLWFMGRKESDTTERLNWTKLVVIDEATHLQKQECVWFSFSPPRRLLLLSRFSRVRLCATP